MESSKIVFTENLFPSTPSAERYTPIGSLESARARLTTAIQRAEGPGLVIGAPGTGKSLLCDILRQYFSPRFDVVLLAEARIRTRRSLFQHILHHLSLPYSHLSEGELRLSLFDHATRDRQEGGRPVLLIVDEAQGLPGRLLEELRLLTGIVHEGESRVHLVLSGSPALDERLTHPRLEPLCQRIAARCYLHPLNHQETGNYIRELLARSRNTRWEIEDEAIRSAYFASDGIPRLLNQTLGLAISEALAEGTSRLTALHVDRAWVSLQQLPGPSHSLHPTTSNHDDLWFDNERAANTAGETSGTVEFGPLDDAFSMPGAKSYDPMAETVDYEPPSHRNREEIHSTGEQDHNEYSSDDSQDEAFDEQVESDIDERVVRFEAPPISAARTETLHASLFGNEYSDETLIDLAIPTAHRYRSEELNSSGNRSHATVTNTVTVTNAISTNTETYGTNDAPELERGNSCESHCEGSCASPCDNRGESSCDTTNLSSVELAFVHHSGGASGPSNLDDANALSEELSIHQQVVALNRETACQAGISFSTVTSNPANPQVADSLRFDAQQGHRNPHGEAVDSFEFCASTNEMDIVDLIETDEALPVSLTLPSEAREPEGASDISIRDDRDLLVIEEEVQNESTGLFRLRPSADQETIADQRHLLDRMRDV